MTHWSKATILIVGLSLTIVVTLLAPAGFGIVITFAAVLAAVVLTGAVFPPTLAMVADVAHGNEAMGATTGLIGLLNLFGSMVAPWAFGALLVAFGTAPGDPGYTAGFAMLAGFALAGVIGTAFFMLLRRRGR
jgi:MFS family permease